MLLVSMTTKCANEEKQQTSGVILRNQPPPPPHCWGPGHRKWNSSGKEADVAGGQVPAPAEAGADASAAPPSRQAVPKDLAQHCVLFLSGHPAQFSLWSK